MGPLTFLNGAFLAALAAAALPILIHLLSRRRAREAPFSHLRFLDEITRRKVRRMKLRQWLLLALRTLAVAFIALALSQPVWHGPGAQSHRGSSTIAILVDDSFSMEARLDPGTVLPLDADVSGLDLPTRFEEARQRALQVVDLLQPGDRAILVFTASPVRVPYESTVRDPALLREELLRAAPRPSRADLNGALERVYPILASARTLNREIFIISDFQRNQALEILRGHGVKPQAAVETPGTAEAPGEAVEAATGTPGEAVAAAARAPVLPVPGGTRVYVLPVSSAGTSNVALVSAFFERDPADAGGRLTVRARNLGERPVEQTVVQVLNGDGRGGLLAEGFVSMDPGALVQTVISMPAGPPPKGLLAVRSGPDLLERDNLRYLTTASSSRFDVLVVTGGPLTDSEVRDEVRFLLLALDPVGGLRLLNPRARSTAPGDNAGLGDAREPGAAGGPPGGSGTQLFEVQTIAEGDLGLMGRIDADAVVLLNVGRLSAAAAELVEHFQADGGGILIAAGDRVDPRTYNTQILPRLGEVRLTNVAGDLDGSTHFTLRPAVVGHGIFAGFPLAPGQALTSARFRRFIGTRTGSHARILAEFSAGHPALIEEPGLLLFTSSLDMRWSDFPTSASYLPFLHRVLLQLILAGRIGRDEPLVGKRLSWPVPSELGREVFRCVGPGGIEIPIEVVQTDRGSVVISDPVHAPGFYELIQSDGGAPHTFAVNVDTRESDLVPMIAGDRELLFGGDAVHLAPGETISRQVLEARYGRELWRLFLALAFCLLVAESLIARGRVIA